jgi:mono/diheme cytochrome c family protein
MRNRVLQLGAFTIAALGATPVSIGGWAVITVDDLPQTLAVGQPTRIEFMVRQHGVTPLDQLTPTIVASDDKRGASEVTASAIKSGPAGHYVATLVVPRTGDWTVTINSGFGASRVTLYPIPATTTPTHSPDDNAPADVGRRLFVAKGCVTCHVHDAAAGNNSIAVGPNLTPRRYQADYLAKLLANPTIARTPGQQSTMPNLGLKTAEIAALVAFINVDRQVSTR